jgi:hypothetical protein
MLSSADIHDPSTVAALLRETLRALHPGADGRWLMGVFGDVEALFGGRHADYQPIDLHYHDFRHTLEVTVCLARLFEGWHLARAEPRLTARQFELGMAAALLHDAGYLRLRSDTAGTGAKYTYCHVLRSSAFLAAYLPSRGASALELETALGAVNCTGPQVQMSRLRFREQADRVIGCCVGTADYLAQMASPRYPDLLEVLYHEFQESDDYLGVPADARCFKSERDLIGRTPAFWSVLVQPKLERDFQGVYRYLGRPDPAGKNEYVEAIERNIARIQARLACASESVA